MKSLIVPFAEVLAKLVSFANILLIMTVLSKNEYADYSYIISIVIWASVIMDGGISNLIFNESLRGDLGKINLFFSARFFLAITITFGIGILFKWWRPLLTTSGILYSIIILISSSSMIAKLIARGLGVRKIDIAIILTEPILRLILVLGLYLFFPSFQWTLLRFLLIYLFVAIITMAISYNYLKPLYQLKIHFNRIPATIKNIFNALDTSKHYLFYYFIYVGLIRMDIIVIELNLSKNELADFASANQIFTVVLLFFTAINTSQFKKIIQKQAVYLKILTIVLVGVAIFFHLFSHYIILILPSTYYSASFVLNKIMIAIIPSVLSIFFILKNNFYHRSKINFIILLIPFLLKLILYICLKPDDLIYYINIFIICEFLLLILFVLYELFGLKNRSKGI